MATGEGISLELQKFIGEPLLQHGELPVAAEIKNPLGINKGILKTWLIFAREICNKQGFQCLAFTELKPDVRKILGFSEQLSSRVIFYRTDMEERGELILNPRIDINSSELIPNFELCGSIEKGKLGYFIGRPAHLSLRGFFYDGESIEEMMLETDNPYNYEVHEVNHLDGRTAINSPEKILDIRKDWDLIKKWYSESSEEELRRCLKIDSPEGILTYDFGQKKFVLVSADGQLIGDYKAPMRHLKN